MSAAQSTPAPWHRLAALIGTRAYQQMALLVAVLVLAGALMTSRLIETATRAVAGQVVETLAVEAEGIAALTRSSGSAAASQEVARLARTHPDRIYFLESADGTRLAGNLTKWPDGMPKGASAGSATAGAGSVAGGTFEYAPQGGAYSQRAAGLARMLPGGAILLVGRDLEPQRRLAQRMQWIYLLGFGALAIAGLAAGLMASRHVLARVGDITRTSEEIVKGDLSARIPVGGSQDELDRLAAALNAMLDRMEMLMSALREVSDNIAHDLKTPLTRLRGRAEQALREGSRDAVRDGLARVIEDADEVIKTFNALLLIARLEAGALEATAQAFDVVPLVRDVAELYEPVAEEAGLVLAFQASARCGVRANRQLIGQAVANMIDNAIKYGTPSRAKQGECDISVSVERVGGKVRIAVADRGPGIGAADRERVLKRFVRLDASRSRPGTGLGLSLVAAVARLHGGRVSLEDHEPGLRIVLELPWAEPALGRSNGVDDDSADARHVAVLRKTADG